jgi:hypothetical protein
MFAPWAPLYAEPRFFPDDKQFCREFTKLTGIQMLTDRPQGAYSILNDPDTGIRSPSAPNQTVGRKHTHIAIDTIVDQLQTPGVHCVITFDQSIYRNSGQSREQQLLAKTHCLAKKGFPGFYYVSHAPFLFATPNIEALKELRRILTSAGIPEKRLENPK